MKGIVKAVVFLLILFNSSVYSQTPSLRHYTVSDGLLSNEVYQVFQDSKGYIWLAHSNGLVRFNGSDFVNVDKDNVLKSAECHELAEDRLGRIWVVTSTGNTFIYDYAKDKICPFKYNKQVSDSTRKTKGHIKYSLIPFNDSLMVLSLKGLGAFRFKRNGPQLMYPNQKPFVFVDLSFSRPFVSNIRLRENNHLRVLFKNKKVVDVPLYKKIQPTHIFSTVYNDSTFVISLDNNIYVINRDGTYDLYRYKNPIVNIFKDKKNRLFISFFSEGVRVFKNPNFKEKPLLHFMKNETCTAVVEDFENGFWFSTLNSGLYYIPSFAFTMYTKEDGLLSNKISRVYCRKGELWVGYSDGFVTEVKNNNWAMPINYSIAFDILARPKSFFYNRRDSSIFVCSNKLYKIKEERIYDLESHIALYNSNPNYAIWPREVKWARDGGMWIASQYGIKKVYGDSLAYDSFYSGDFKFGVNCIFEDSNNTLWIGSRAVWIKKGETYRNLALLNPIFDCNPSKIIQNPYDNRIWIASRNLGVIIYDGKEAIILDKKSGLQSNSISSMDIYGNEVWITSTAGIDKLTLTHRNPLRYVLTSFNKSHGVIDSDINNVCINDFGAYFATSSGVLRYDRAEFNTNATSPKIIVTSFKVNKREHLFEKKKTLKSSENYIEVGFDALTYKNVGNRLCRYKLEGLNDGWLYTKENHVVFYPLQPGKYKLHIAAQNNDGLWSATPATIEFSIGKPFWRTFGFMLLMFMLVVGLVYSIMKVRIKVLTKMNMLERKSNLWKNQSLGLQMNPHFIFNTLNSIQLYILKCDVDSSILYLSKFSGLMRKTLENSNKGYVTLKEELDALELYIELETLRCENKFTYSIECDRSIIKTETYIPTLLIQPFVENAIWHGIMPKQGNGRVLVTIQDIGSYLKCRIVDDGIGRSQSREIQKKRGKKHRSMAAQITSSRIEMLKSLYSKDFELEYEDLYDIEGNSIGTEVILIIPRDFQLVKQTSLTYDGTNKSSNS